jgi:hypothetical protein
MQGSLTWKEMFRGEGAHIVGQKQTPESPRGDDPLPATERDLAGNILLACSNCHTEIDKLLAVKKWVLQDGGPSRPGSRDAAQRVRQGRWSSRTGHRRDLPTGVRACGTGPRWSRAGVTGTCWGTIPNGHPGPNAYGSWRKPPLVTDTMPSVDSGQPS